MGIRFLQSLILRKTCFFFSVIIISGSSIAQEIRPVPQETEIAAIQRRYGLNVATPLAARVVDASAEVIRNFQEAGMSPRQHQLTTQERDRINAAFAQLPPLHKRVLASHLRSVSFLDDMPNTALTSTINPGDSFLLFDITFRAGILKQNLSEWITEKERTCFDIAGSGLTVSIDAGRLDAIAYVLMHETTHVVDGSLVITPGRKATLVAPNTFVSGVWTDRTVIASPFQNGWLDSIRFRRGRVISIQLADSVYNALARTPFVSLYSTSSWHEDLAEFISVYDLTQIRKQPFRIVLHDGNHILFSYEPMKSGLVRKRIRYIRRFY